MKLGEQLTPPGRQATYKSMCESQALKLQNVGVINYARHHQLLGCCSGQLSGDSASATAARLDGTIEQRALKDPRVERESPTLYNTNAFRKPRWGVCADWFSRNMDLGEPPTWERHQNKKQPFTL